MTFRLFHTFKAGPFHATVSRAGLSLSAGGRNARVGTRPGRRGLRASVRAPGGWRLRKG